MTDNETLEKRGLWMSIFGALFMAALGIGFAILTSSDAVLLDGLFSLVGFAIGLVSLRVATLVRRPDDELYHFGYAAYEPMVNLTKGLLMAFITIFALVSAVEVAVHDALKGDFDNLALDVVFTRDPHWMAVSVGDGVVSSGG